MGIGQPGRDEPAVTHAELPDIDSLWDFARPDESEQRFRDVLPAARASGNSKYLAELLTQIARTHSLRRQFEQAHATLDEAEALLDRAGERATVRYLLERGRTYNSAGRPEEAIPLFLRAWELAREHDEEYLAIDAAHMLGISEQPERQLEWSLRALELAESSRQPRSREWLGPLYNNIGWTYHDLGRYEEALDLFLKSVEWRESQNDGPGTRIARWTVGRALRSLGRFDEALALQRENLRAVRQSEEADTFVQEEIGECLLAMGRDEEAKEHLARAYAVLAQDPWVREHEPGRLERLRSIAGVEVQE